MPSFNRTIVELKRGFMRRIMEQEGAFNRTIVELKRIGLYLASWNLLPFNRTIVELKPGSTRYTMIFRVYF